MGNFINSIPLQSLLIGLVSARRYLADARRMNLGETLKKFDDEDTDFK